MTDDPQTVASGAADQMQWGSFLSGFGSIISGIAGFRAARYKAQVAKINAQIAKYNEENALQTGEQNALRYGLQASQRMGAIRSAQGSSGIDVNTGSAVDVQKSQQMVTKMDLDQIRQNAARQAYNYDVERVGFLNQAKLDSATGLQSLFKGGLDAGTSFLSSSQSVASKWYQGKQAGLGPNAQTPTNSDNIFGSSGRDAFSGGHDTFFGN